ncbi:hypothetical protein Ciccas_013961 [Cichlidogyrus casuarinus]|uniref:Uncharacterized protein n=1 Tax=Cichlidogyrus casuarinus TaxID=1844966 RepID=A0ABD2PL00_9PLAT
MTDDVKSKKETKSEGCFSWCPCQCLCCPEPEVIDETVCRMLGPKNANSKDGLWIVTCCVRKITYEEEDDDLRSVGKVSRADANNETDTEQNS